MAGFRIEARKIELDKGKLSKTLDELMERQIRQAARAWLEAVVLDVPVYSGMARGAFLPLGRYLNRAIDITPTENAVRRNWGGAIHGPAEGASMSSYRFTSDNFVYTFEFDSQVPHFLINEFHVGLGMPPLLHPTPWHSLEAGQAAFNNYLQTILPEKVKNLLSVYITQEITNA